MKYFGFIYNIDVNCISNNLTAIVRYSVYFTVSGMYWGQRRLMLPWLFLQGFLASILASLACYYLVLFPLKNSCISEKRKKDANFRPLVISSATFVDNEADNGWSYSSTGGVYSSTLNRESYSSDENEGLFSSTPSGGSNCHRLLWYGAIMISSILILFYYFYIVNVSIL